MAEGRAVTNWRHPCMGYPQVQAASRAGGCRRGEGMMSCWRERVVWGSK
jgi:hypothetical protein